MQEINKDKDEVIEIYRKILRDIYNNRGDLYGIFDETISNWLKGHSTSLYEVLKKEHSPLREALLEKEELQTKCSKLRLEISELQKIADKFVESDQDLKEVISLKVKQFDTLCMLRAKIRGWMDKERKNISQEVWEEMRREGEIQDEL